MLRLEAVVNAPLLAAGFFTALRLMAIWLVVQGAAESSQFVVILLRIALKNSKVDPFFLSLHTIPYIAQFVLGIVLWLGATSISQYVMIKTRNDIERVQQDSQLGWQQIAFSGIGIYLLIKRSK